MFSHKGSPLGIDTSKGARSPEMLPVEDDAYSFVEPAHLHAVRTHAESVLSQERGAPPLTAQAFVSNLRIAAEEVRLDEIRIEDIPPSVLEKMRRDFATCWDIPRMKDNLRGLLPEVMLPLLLRRKIPETIKELEQIHAADIDLHDESFQVCQGRQQNEVLIESRERSTNLMPFMEFDVVYRIGSSGEYIAFDPTCKVRNHFETGKRTEKLQRLTELLGKNIVLIDVVLKNSHFVWSLISEHIHRWHLPCTVDFDEVIRQIIPRKLWGKVID